MINIICTDLSGADRQVYEALYHRASFLRRDRADRYRREEDALRCLAAGALLRYALGTDKFTEDKMPNGKPFIREKPDFHFNLSHAGCWVVLAFGDSPVGVDVERIRPETDIASISRRFFAEEEQRYILEDPDQSRSRFFEIWTVKESYIKFLGTGLKTDLTAFSVLNGQPDVRYYHWKLSEGYCLSLCTREEGCERMTVNVQDLL